MFNLRVAVRRASIAMSTCAAAYLAVTCFAPSSTETAVANGDTRTLHLYHTHTFETIDATFRVNGHYDPTVLAQLNHFLRDWRNNDEHVMDPRLFDAVWEAYRTAGATDRIQIYSAYRSPETNAMLRRRSRAVAEHSQHMLGKAMDTTMPGFPMSRIREAGMKLQHGGVGWYPAANFVHLDVGGVRSWPRMSYDQLARIFPDGKTVHISSDGRTMPGYDQARMELAQRGDVQELPPEQQSTGFFAWLFGGGSNGGAAREDEEDRRAPVAVASAAPPAAPEPAPQAPPPQQAAAPQPALAYAQAETPQPYDRAPDAPDRAMQTASLETDAQRPVDLAPLPIPTRRPDTLIAASLEPLPLPPVRPGSFDRIQTASIRYSDAQSAPVRADAIGGMITANANGLPAIRKSKLPAIITHGGNADRAPPSEMLAFASSESMADDRPLPMPVTRPNVLAKPPLALRGGRRHTVADVGILDAKPAKKAVAAEAASDAIAGPRLTGLRRAARLMADGAAL